MSVGRIEQVRVIGGLFCSDSVRPVFCVVGAKSKSTQTSEAGEKYSMEEVFYFVIPSETRNLSSVCAHRMNDRFLASLGMTKGCGTSV
jgi:hypothetical protein